MKTIQEMEFLRYAVNRMISARRVFEALKTSKADSRRVRNNRFELDCCIERVKRLANDL